MVQGSLAAPASPAQSPQLSSLESSAPRQQSRTIGISRADPSWPMRAAAAASSSPRSNDTAPSNGTSPSNGASPANGQPKARQPASAEELTVQCALEGACVLLERDTPLSEALGLLDEAAQSVALIVRPPPEH